MSKITSWGSTNVSPSVKEINPTVLNLFSEYASEATPGGTVYKNLTGPISCQERLTIKASSGQKVKLKRPIAFPPKVNQGVMYSIQLEDILSTTDSEDATFRVDNALAVTITVRHDESDYITAEHVEAAISRALGGFYYSDGTTRIPRLMKLATQAEKN